MTANQLTELDEQLERYPDAAFALVNTSLVRGLIASYMDGSTQLTAALDRERVLKEKVGKLRAVLSGFEWGFYDDSAIEICQKCHNLPEVGHEPDCTVGQIMAETEDGK